ncbi:YqgE/AlgH family protein [Candidatus Synchoanobacter obligatus]|uniref:YqgE/AlgH family protein n=1 Tax=Candidatus Synchoanobacter obligatus TaxID=2919597 RepID=A0ABT1L5T4_9GAMM|nr:YqgE/AlgH family protein [Candidatus Synchoanobacter obligatus]MCP8352238.1 YqgE/AlgH family protein [Candidatus Synchoanobacter obligatus]
MENIYLLEGSYLVASPSITQDGLRGALVYLYQVDRETVSGVIINKPCPEEKTVGDYLAYPKYLQNRIVWQGGPNAVERLIAFSHLINGELHITDRLSKLTESQLKQCMFISGQCIWEVSALMSQIRSGDWLLVGSNYVLPSGVPAESRIPYVLKNAGIDFYRLVSQPAAEVTWQ